MPSHATFGRVCARLNPQRLQECFLAWTRAVAQRPQRGRIALAGQTVKASVDRATASSPLHMLAAWCSENGGLVIGQIKTETQSHAMTAIPALLHWLAIKGWIVTIDAMGYQTAMAGQIRPHGGDSLFAWKGNPPKAYPAVKQYLPQPSDPQLAWRTAEHCFDAFEDSHGRTVRRRGWTITDLVALPALTQWLDLQAIIVGATIRAAYPGAPITTRLGGLLPNTER